MKIRSKKYRGRNRRGIVIVLVLIIVVFLALAVLTFSDLMFSENQGTTNAVRRAQVSATAESGIDYFRSYSMNDIETILDDGGLYDNPDLFKGHIVDDGTGELGGNEYSRDTVDERDIARFTFIVPRLAEDGSMLEESSQYIRYGFEDETGKLNLRWVVAIDKELEGQNAGRTFLMRLPGMDEEIADCILDWCDDDDEAREYGVEYDYYASLDPPYAPRNGIPDTIDELLLVKGVTAILLYGADWNRNGKIDPGEPDPSLLFSDLTIEDGILDLGLAAYLTIDSRESKYAPDGLFKINLNQEDTSTLSEEIQERLSGVDGVSNAEEWANAILAARENGEIGSIFSLVQGASSAAALLGAISGGENAESTENAAQALAGANSSSNTNSPFTANKEDMVTYLPVLYDYFMTGKEPPVGRININQAPLAVLNLLRQSESEMEQESGGTDLSVPAALVERIFEERIINPVDAVSEPEKRYPFWIYTSGIIDEAFGEEMALSVMAELDKYITTEGCVYRTQIIGRYDRQSPVTRLEVYFDTSVRPAKVLRVRDLSEFGPGYPASTLGIEPYQNR